MTLYNITFQTIDGSEQSIEHYRGKVLLIVNTASKCGFTPQYTQLEELYNQYKDQGLVVLGFPSNQFMNQEPGNNEEIASFCKMEYGVTFPMFAKTDVKGENAHPLFTYLTEHAPGVLGLKAVKWNFTKFLVDRNGEVVQRYAPQTNPSDIKNDIEELLK